VYPAVLILSEGEAKDLDDVANLLKGKKNTNSGSP
jgi:hypothetical protein